MLKPQILGAVALSLLVSACGSEPVAYDEPHYVSSASSGPYYDRHEDVAYNDYGRVVAIDVVQGSGRTHGGGAVLGGLAGGILGHQIGSGRGNTAATVAGAVGGAVVGNEVERRRNDDEYYRVTVQFRDGREASFTQDSLDGIRVGDRVRVDGNHLARD
jgi:outer membrane lipoprotein SlyB